MHVQLVAAFENRAHIALLVREVVELALRAGCNGSAAYRKARSAYLVRLALLSGFTSLCLLVAARNAETERIQAMRLATRKYSMG